MSKYRDIEISTGGETATRPAAKRRNDKKIGGTMQLKLRLISAN
jgi:hypothetical protein